MWGNGWASALGEVSWLETVDGYEVLSITQAEPEKLRVPLLDLVRAAVTRSEGGGVRRVRAKPWGTAVICPGCMTGVVTKACGGSWAWDGGTPLPS